MDKMFEFSLITSPARGVVIGVLNPASPLHYYEDEYADGYIKAVCKTYYGGVWECSKVTTHKIEYEKVEWSSDLEPYFVKYGCKYFLSTMQHISI